MCSGARAAFAAAIVSFNPATPPRMWMCADAPPSAATRNMRSISAIGAPGVYALPNPTATAPSAAPRAARLHGRHLRLGRRAAATDPAGTGRAWVAEYLHARGM